MEKVTKTWMLSTDNMCGVTIPHDLMEEIKTFIAEKVKSDSRCIPYNWTLNHSWNEDGKQVIIHFPDNDRVRDVATSIMSAESNVQFSRGLFTAEVDYDTVAQMCKSVAVGEMIVE